MKKLYDNNKIHHTTKTPVINISEATNKYVGDFYLKDYSYLSAGAARDYEKRKKEKDMKLFRGGVRQTCHLVVRTWLKEVLEGLKHFLYQGSLHGVKYIFEPTFSRVERATWVIIVVVSIGICTGVIVELFSKSSSIPFVNVIDSLPTPIWAVPFPSVVLCPNLHVQLSFANVTELDELHKFFASSVCPGMAGENKVLEKRLTAKEIQELQYFILGGSPNCTNIVKRCYWRGLKQRTKWMTEECCETLFKPLFTNYGLCFSFNGLPLNGMSNATIPWQKSLRQDVVPGTLNWGLDSGYPKVFPPDPTILPFRVTASGEANGLGLELYMNTSEHQPACDGSSMGFNFLAVLSFLANGTYQRPIGQNANSYMSQPSVSRCLQEIVNALSHQTIVNKYLKFPQTAEERQILKENAPVRPGGGIRLPMDRMTTIEVTPITYKTDSNLRYLTPERRQCFFQNERQLVFYEFYTDSNCKHDLLVLEAQRQCNCVLFHWPRKRITEPICVTARDFQCIDEVKAKVEEQLIYAYFADSEEQRPHHRESSSCHPSCNDIIYSSQVFYSDLIKDPSDVDPEWGNPKAGEVTRINVHFYEDMFLGQHRHAQYDDYYFIGAIGGLLSLFLGFSIISVAELLYFVLLRPIYIVLRDTVFQY